MKSPLSLCLIIATFSPFFATQDGATTAGPDLIEIPLNLEFRAAKDKGILSEPYNLYGTSSKPELIRKTPNFTGEILYYSFEVGLNEKYIYYFALQKDSESSYVIYLDRNRNGDLTDDKPMPLRPLTQVGKVKTTDLSLDVPCPGNPETKIGMNLFLIDGSPSISIICEDALVGNMILSGKSYKIYLTTSKYIQPTSKGMETPERVTLLFIDWNGNGLPDLPSDRDNGEIFHLSNQRIVFGGKTYSGTVSYKPAMITLKAR